MTGRLSLNPMNLYDGGRWKESSVAGMKKKEQKMRKNTLSLEPVVRTLEARNKV